LKGKEGKEGKEGKKEGRKKAKKEETIRRLFPSHALSFCG